jgi:hypothetical protein
MNKTGLKQRRLALLLLGIGMLIGVVLLAVGAPLWAFYFAPLFTAPIVIVALNVDPPRRHPPAASRRDHQAREQREPIGVN